MRFFIIPLLLMSFSPLILMAELNLILPTANHNIYDNPSAFYMRTKRSGSDAWKGGMYGFTRNAKHLKAGVVYSRFHEGIDIAPLERDKRGVPLDSVISIDDGKVVHVNAVSGKSNYGKYIVVEHVWDGSPFYSLYAHLNEVWVEAGEDIERGSPLGRLGYTGHGINKARAHLHFEIAMLVNTNFQVWYDEEYGDDKNYHGYYNGMNLAGIDVAHLYHELNSNPELTIREFIECAHEPFYTVLMARNGRLDILNRYPWLLKSSAEPSDQSWKITFDASGFPLGVEPSKDTVKGPTLTWVQEARFPYSYMTKSRVRGNGGKGYLSEGGKKFMRLIGTELIPIAK